MPVVVLTTTGRRTGRARPVTLTAIEHEGRMLLVASGHRDFDRHPAWYLNLRDQPRVTLAAAGQDPRPMTARTLTKAEKEAVWPVIVARWKGFASYQQRTARDIPVVELQPPDGDT
jgi:deazaflavin-dependent oxidoreductase (nitroreductase family)